MEYIYGILLATLGLTVVIIIKLSTTLFHELGHAIPALMFTNKKVEVYIGSYGDSEKTIQLEFGRLKIYLNWNIITWQLGMCRHEQIAANLWKETIILLGGPIASLLISIPLLLTLKHIESNSTLQLVSIIFIAAAAFDFFTNMIPSSKPIEIHNGKKTYCDGYALYQIYKRKTSPKQYFELEKLFVAQKYRKVIELGEKMLLTQQNKRYVYDFIIKSLIILNNKKRALKYYETLSNNFQLEDYDSFEIGKLYSSNGDYINALKFFKKFWFKNYKNIELLNAIGNAQIELGLYEEAIKTLITSLNIENNNLQAVLLRSKAYVKLKKYSLAESALRFAIEINANEPMIYFHLGIINEKRFKHKEAIKYFVLAKEMNCTYPKIDILIENLKTKVQR